jgi:hypothetical protein
MLARARDEGKLDVRFRLVVYTLVVTKIHLHRKEVSIAPLWILYDPQADILIAERLELSHWLSEFVRIVRELYWGRRPYRRSRVIDRTDVAGGGVLGRRIIRPVRVTLKVVVVVVAIEDEVAILATQNICTVITVIALVIVRSLVCIRRELGIKRFRVGERIEEASTPWCVTSSAGLQPV